MKLKYLYLGLSLFFKITINVLVIFFIAKKVSVEDFGSFSLAFIFSTVSVSLLDYGFSLKSLTLAGKEKKIINKEMYLMIYGKIFIGIVFSILFFAFLFFSNLYDFDTKIIIALLVFSSIPLSFGNFYLNSFKIKNRYKEESKGFFLQGALLILLLIINEFYGEDSIVYYSMIILITRVLYFIYAKSLFDKEFTLNEFTLVKTKIFLTLKAATPFATHLIFGVLIIYIDTFVLSIFTSLENVGIYQAAMRLIMATMILAVIVSDAFIPEISALIKNQKNTKKKLSNLFQLILFFSLLVVITIYFYDKTIIKLLFNRNYLVLGEYIIYIISIVFLRYMGIVSGVVLTSFNKQNIRANAVIVAVLISIVLNVILIPKIGIKGAFISSLFAHFVLNLIYLYGSLKKVKYINVEKNVIVSFLTLILYVFAQYFFFTDSNLHLTYTVLFNILLIAIYLFMNNQGFKFQKSKLHKE